VCGGESDSKKYRCGGWQAGGTELLGTQGKKHMSCPALTPFRPEPGFFPYRTFNRVKVTFELPWIVVCINLAISLLPTFRPPYFKRLCIGMGIWMGGGLEGLKPLKKGIIYKGLIINGL
jgi:hypothetical protein